MLDQLPREPWLQIQDAERSLLAQAASKFKFGDLMSDFLAGNEKRALFSSKFPAEYRFEEITVGEAAAHWILPPGASEDRVVLYFHGGAYLSGSGTYCKYSAFQLAKHVGLKTLTVDYRLAPKHRFPAALGDGFGAYRQLLERGYAPEHIAFAGDSAGGGLAFCVALLAHERALPAPACIAAFSPWTDLTNSLPSHHSQRDPLFPNGIQGASLYYASESELQNPFVSPLYGDMARMPPTFICVGENELLLSDSLEMGRKMQAANRSVVVQVWPRLYHVFPIITPHLPESTRAFLAVSGFLRARLGLKHCTSPA